MVEERDPVDGDPGELVRAFYEWLSSDRGVPSGRDDPGFKAYWRGIAEARYVIRKVSRIVDEQARKVGLDPLEHQALIQIVGARVTRRVSDLAERLDIAPAFASRLVRGLESNALVTRAPSSRDKRSILVMATDRGRELLSQVDDAVALHMSYFLQQLSDAERAVAFATLASYAGASDVEGMEALMRIAYSSLPAPDWDATSVK